MTVSLVPSLTAHGVVSRQDLPIPLVYLLVGSVAALLVSFLALVVLWREPRLDWVHAGRPLPPQVQRVLDSPALRTGLQALGLLAAAYVAAAALFGPDDDSNPTPGVVYVLFWVGVPLLSMLLGPVWRLLNPIRTIDTAVTRATGTDPEAAAWPLPHRVGHWPAALMLLAFVWIELAAPDNTSRLVLCLFFGTYLAVNLLAGLAFGSRWFSRGDGFEVYSTLLGHLSCLGRRGDGQLVLRNPLAGVAGTPAAPVLSGVVCVLLGSTAYDSLGSSPWWVNVVQSEPLPATLTKTLGLVTMGPWSACCSSTPRCWPGGARTCPPGASSRSSRTPSSRSWPGMSWRTTGHCWSSTGRRRSASCPTRSPPARTCWAPPTWS
jgi:hypothetical protein